MYEHGRGVKKSKAAAIELYRASAARRDENSKAALKMIEKTLGVK